MNVLTTSIFTQIRINAKGLCHGILSNFAYFRARHGKISYGRKSRQPVGKCKDEVSNATRGGGWGET